MEYQGLDQAVLRVLTQYKGREHAVSRTDLVFKLRSYDLHERQVRELIKELRRSGHLIGSAPGYDGGYYMIQSAEEFQDFMTMEYQAKINDMRVTAQAMTKQANRVWGNALQPKLF